MADRLAGADQGQVKRRVVVFHRGYGCETGCCGHAIEIDGDEVPGSFEFSHPYGGKDDFREWAVEFITEALGAEHAADLDWENCVIIDD